MDALRRRFARPFWGLVVFTATILTTSIPLHAQQPTAIFRSYQPRFTTLDVFAKRLRQVLAEQDASAHVVVDTDRKQVLVQGSDKAQQLAMTVQRRFDTPSRSSQNLVAQAPQSTLRPYTGNATFLKQFSVELKKRYANRSDVQVAFDARNNRLLVNAPEEIHNKLTVEIADRTDVVRPKQNPAPEPRRTTASNQAASTQTVQLRNITWQRLVSSLQGMSPARLALAQIDGSTDLELNVPSPLGNSNFRINPANGLVTVTGANGVAGKWVHVVRSLDKPDLKNVSNDAKIVPLRAATPASVTRAVQLLQTAVTDINRPDLRRAGGPQRFNNGDDNLLAQADGAPAERGAPGVIGVDGSLIGPVQIDFVDGFDAIIVKGRKQDVDRIMKIIQDLEDISRTTQPEIKLFELKHVNSEAMAELITQLNQETTLQARQGSVSITPLVKPNALLLIGRPEGVKATEDLINRLDQPIEPETQFKVFRLKHMPADNAQVTIDSFFAERTGLGARVQVQSDYRTNSVIIYASPRDMEEVRLLLQKIDVNESDVYSEVKVFQLKNASASELAALLQQTLRGEQGPTGGAGTGGGQQGGFNQQRPGAPPTAAQTGSQGGQNRGGAGGTGATGGSGTISSMLTLSDDQRRRILQSGILTDVRISADNRTNSLVITAPKESMELIQTLVEQLDQLPTAEAQIDVFPIEHGNALAIVTALTTLFGNGQTQQTTLGTATAASSGESSLVPLRFSYDQRSNTVIATGSGSDLAIVDSIITRLDEAGISRRNTQIVQLLNAPAQDVATAINQYINSEIQVIAQAPESLSPYVTLERQIVVVPELVTNSLIISATPQHFEKILEMVTQLDARPPMVMIQVLIAEVALDNTEDFGVELGVQDSLLFDRSAAGVPGFNFNNLALGNSTSAESLATRETLAGQALSNFALGRNNADLGYGGLVLSASNESISILVRALQETGRLDVLSRPQIMTLNNQPASILVGSLVPILGGTTLSTFGQTNDITQQQVGLSLGVTPRISPDGMVVMEIDAIKSSLGAVSEGIPVSINANGDAVRQPIINSTQASTTVSARSGQTIILGGLITKDRSIRTRRVPYIADIPVLGSLFRFDSEVQNRTELLFIMTPYIVRKDEDIEWLKQVETQRMSWCLADVIEIHGDGGFNSKCGPMGVTSEMMFPTDYQTIGSEYEPTIIESNSKTFETEGGTVAPAPEAILPHSTSNAATDINVANWDQVRERQIKVNLNENLMASQTQSADVAEAKPQKEPSRFGKIWSKLRGRRVEEKADEAKFISPVQFVEKVEVERKPKRKAKRELWSIP